MKRFCGLVACLLVLSVTTAATAGSKAEENFKQLAADILKNLQRFDPVNATYMGVHEYNDRFADYSPSNVENQRRVLRKFLARLYKYKSVRLPHDMDIDRRLLSSNCEMATLRLWEVPYHKINPNLYLDDAANGIYYVLIRNYAPLETRLDDIIARMNDLPRYLKQAEGNLSAPPPLWLEYARENIANVREFYLTAGRELEGQFPVRGPEISSAVTVAISALNAYEDFLTRLEPGEPGSFAIGRDYFDYILKHDFLFDFDADSLLALGEALLAETTAKYDEYLQKMNESGDGNDENIFVPSSFTRDDVLDYYNWEIAAVRQFVVDQDLVTVPENIGFCEAVETPAFLRGVIGGIAYMPAGPFDTATTGYFYVPPLPDELTADERAYHFRRAHNRQFRGAVVHEAYPGHHLQLQLATGAYNDVRRWQMNNGLIEGWALYCEEMAYDAGLYLDDSARYLRILSGIGFRAARIVVDVKLHTGQFDFDRAVAWMSEVLEADTAFIKREVLRYTMTPGQPMSYLTGKRQITDLRREMERREGDDFDLKSFHDRLLAEGSIPVSLIREKMLR